MSAPPKQHTFLIADDDKVMRELMARMLKSGFPGSSVVQVSSPNQVLNLAANLKPQLILLDWVFPGGMTGASVCQQVKRHPQTRMIPVILISGERKHLNDRIRSVYRGADLFLSKPITVEELCGYVRALLDRTKALTHPLRIGPLSLIRSSRNGSWNGVPLPHLTLKQFEMLWMLARKSPQPVPARDFVRQIWDDVVRDKHVTLAVARLRKKLSPVQGLEIESVPGIGYRLLANA